MEDLSTVKGKFNEESFKTKLTRTCGEHTTLDGCHSNLCPHVPCRERTIEPTQSVANKRIDLYSLLSNFLLLKALKDIRRVTDFYGPRQLQFSDFFFK